MTFSPNVSLANPDRSPVGEERVMSAAKYVTAVEPEPVATVFRFTEPVAPDQLVSVLTVTVDAVELAVEVAGASSYRVLAPATPTCSRRKRSAAEAAPPLRASTPPTPPPASTRRRVSFLGAEPGRSISVMPRRWTLDLCRCCGRTGEPP